MTCIRKVPREIKIYGTLMVPMASLASRTLRWNLGVVQIIIRRGELHRRFHTNYFFPRRAPTPLPTGARTDLANHGVAHALTTILTGSRAFVIA